MSIIDTLVDDLDEDSYLESLIKPSTPVKDEEEFIPKVGLSSDEALYERALEAILFACREPMSLSAIKERFPETVNVQQYLARLQRQYEGRGIELREVNGNWAFRTASDLSFLLQREVEEVRRLNKSTLEVLTIIAYHQPITRAEIEDIRGVSLSKGTLDTLMEMGWVKIGKRRETPGRPLTFLTTDAFLDHFGLESVRDLPGIKELKDAGFLDHSPQPVFPQWKKMLHDFEKQDQTDEA